MITDVRDLTSFKWATVRGTAPLSIQLDGDSSPLALIPDTLVDPLELSVGDRVRVELSLRKVVIHGVSQGHGSAFAGELRATASEVAPTGWMMSQGQSLLRAEYPRLYSAIGVRYGAVDSLHFNTPDTRGRNLIGRDASQAIFDTLGETGGTLLHKHNEGTLHAAIGAVAGRVDSIGYAPGQARPDGRGPASITNYAITGGNLGNEKSFNHYTPVYGHTSETNHLDPFIVVNYIIKY